MRSNNQTCKMCDNLVKWNYQKKDWRVYCSPKCRAIDPVFKQGIIEKYGSHPGHTSEAINKRKNTCIERYGVEFPLQDKGIHQQTLDTTSERYSGILCGSVELNTKQKQTMLDRYGVEYSGQSTKLLEKQFATNLEKYEVEHPLQNSSIKEKQELTNIQISGVSGSGQRHLVEILPLIEDYDWLFNQYITLGKTATQIAAELGCVYYGTIISYLKRSEIDIRYNVGYSYACVSWLESIMEKEGIIIKHALNGGEYQIPGTRYKADGYCVVTNTVYEFHGDVFHGNPKIYLPTDNCHPFDDSITAGELYQKTIEREQQIRELGYNLVVMWESDFVV